MRVQKGDVRKGLLSNGEQMGGAIGALLAGVDLHHAGDVERVDAGKGVGRDQDDTRVGVDFILQVAQLDGLQHGGLVEM